MADTTKIEWCDSTFNPWIGCTQVSPACDDCYAARSTPARTLGVAWGANQPRRLTSKANWSLPRRWNAQAAEFQAQHGRRQRVFCASLADVFDNEVPDAWRQELFNLIAATPNLDWLLLTKRIGNAAAMLDRATLARWTEAWPNVWIGATICNQAEADRDIPKLLATPARVRFLSIEPMLGPIELGLSCENWSDDIVMDPETGAYECCKACDYTGIGNAIDWVICGGESGPLARPMHDSWAKALRDECAAAGVPFLFKQWGEWMPAGQHRAASEAYGRAQIQEFHQLPEGRMHRIGKKAAGRLLDGIEHNGFPETASLAWRHTA